MDETGQWQWAVFHYGRPDVPHREFSNETAAREWVQGWVDYGCLPDTFYVARRRIVVVGPWERAGRTP